MRVSIALLSAAGIGPAIWLFSTPGTPANSLAWAAALARTAAVSGRKPAPLAGQ